MLKALNFVRGAVAQKDLIPILTSIHAYNNRIQGSNGRLTIDAPCALPQEFTVPCAPFLRAVDACQGEPVIRIEERKMFISRDRFKAVLPLDEHAEFPRQEPAGEKGVKMASALLPVLKTLRPFISDDASRGWACGILFRGGNAYATNNIVVATAPGVKFGIDLNLPAYLIDELLRINMEPVSFVACENNITFHFKNTAWLKATLLSAEWPDPEPMLQGTAPNLILDELLDAVQQILPFCPDPKQPVILLCGEGVKTLDGDKSALVSGLCLHEAAYRAEPLIAVLKAATHIDFTQYPKPAPFTGENGLRGILVGVKL